MPGESALVSFVHIVFWCIELSNVQLEVVRIQVMWLLVDAGVSK